MLKHPIQFDIRENRFFILNSQVNFDKTYINSVSVSSFWSTMFFLNFFFVNLFQTFVCNTFSFTWRSTSRFRFSHFSLSFTYFDLEHKNAPKKMNLIMFTWNKKPEKYKLNINFCFIFGYFLSIVVEIKFLTSFPFMKINKKLNVEKR